jgi:hypothetical protein
MAPKPVGKRSAANESTQPLQHIPKPVVVAPLEKSIQNILDAAIIIVSIVIYLNSLYGDFVFDDRVAIVENKVALL